MATVACQVTPPKPFNFTTPVDWTKWIRQFDRFKSASGLQEKSEETQANILVYTMGTEADNIFQSCTLTEEQKKSYNTVKEKFNNHLVKRRNIIFERAMFKQTSSRRR